MEKNSNRSVFVNDSGRNLLNNISRQNDNVARKSMIFTGDLTKPHFFGETIKRMIISNVNHTENKVFNE